MKILRTVVAVSLLLTVLIREAVSQPTIAERSEIPAGPGTKLEALSETTGAVLIRQYTEVGLLGGGAISVAAIIVTNTTSQMETKGLLISPSEVTRGVRSAYVDLDEIPGLLSGIEYMSSVDLATLKLANFAATYQTRGNLTLTAYSDGEAKKAFLSTGRLSSNNYALDLQDLARFRELIAAAMKILDNPESLEAKQTRPAPETTIKPPAVQPVIAVPPKAVSRVAPKAKVKTKTQASAKAKSRSKAKAKTKTKSQ